MTFFCDFICCKSLHFKLKDFLILMASTKCKIVLVETALFIVHADDQMLRIYQVIKKMVP